QPQARKERRGRYLSDSAPEEDVGVGGLQGPEQEVVVVAADDECPRPPRGPLPGVRPEVEDLDPLAGEDLPQHVDLGPGPRVLGEAVLPMDDGDAQAAYIRPGHELAGRIRIEP